MDDEVGVVRLAAGVHLEPAGVGLDHAFGDGETETDARVARGEKRIRGAGGHVGGETATIVAHPEGKPRTAVGPGFGRDRDGDPGRIPGGLEAVEENLLEGVQQARAMAAHERMGHLAENLEFAGLLSEKGTRMGEALPEQLLEGQGVGDATIRLREENHLLGETLDPVRLTGERGLQRVAELGAGVVGVKELLVGGERDERVEDDGKLEVIGNIYESSNLLDTKT